VVAIKRKVIQIANSTQLISLPIKWSKKYGIKKGDELEVEEQGNKVVISTEKGFKLEKGELNINNLEPMILRSIVALYKKGIDEIKVTFDKPELIESIQKAIGKEAVGYEITKQGKNYCIIKHVSGELEQFEPVVRRTFLLLISMAEESLDAIKKGEFEHLKSVGFLEEANNRFTTLCRRMLNKKGYKDNKYLGPLYYIIEEIENIADQYKYLCTNISKYKNKDINKEILTLYEEVNNMFKNFYEFYYKFDKEKLVKLAKQRKVLVSKILNLFEKKYEPPNTLLLHYLFTILQRTFCLVGPFLVIKLDYSGFNT
jgi:phosphate uptake regulator